MARGKKLSAQVQVLAGHTALLTPEDRAALITILHVQGTAPVEYDLLASGFAAAGIRLRAYSVFRKEHQEQLLGLCRLVVKMVEAVKGRRQAYAVVCAWTKAADQRIKRQYAHARGDGFNDIEVTEHMLIRELYTREPMGLIQESFPGYTLEMLGDVLCRQSPSGNASSGTQVLNLGPEELMSPQETSMLNVPGVALKTPRTTLE